VSEENLISSLRFALRSLLLALPRFIELQFSSRPRRTDAAAPMEVGLKAVRASRTPRLADDQTQRLRYVELGGTL
jgi:hypothetical protein